MHRLRGPLGRAASSAHGFTLLELMVVIAMLAVVVGLVTLSLRDADAAKLDEEATRLSVLLDSARARARVSGREVGWKPRGDQPGFQFTGLPDTNPLPDRWLDERTRAEVIGAPALLLGPEPVIGAQRVVLSLGDRRLVLATDGLGPFRPLTDAGSPAR